VADIITPRGGKALQNILGAGGGGHSAGILPDFKPSGIIRNGSDTPQLASFWMAGGTGLPTRGDPDDRSGDPWHETAEP
jgi:hypothetical protein